VITDIVMTAKLRNESVDYEDLNTDVIVHFDSGDKYFATFFSYKSLQNMVEADRASSDLHAEPYYRILDMVLIQDFNNGNLQPIIEAMISEGDFQLVFRKM
jgi:hypothetical protein